MSEVINNAIVELDPKAKSSGLEQVVKYVILDEGEILVDGSGARVWDETIEADVTITASAETFQGLMAGTVNETTAYMSGKINISGDMGLAMKLSSLMG